MKTGALCRAPAPLAGDQLVAIADRAHGDRLHDAVALHRVRQLGKLLVTEVAARIARVAVDQIDRKRAPSAAPFRGDLERRLARRVGPEQSVESAPQAFLRFRCQTSLPQMPRPLGRAERGLALDNLGGKPQIGLTAGAFQIVEKRRLAM